MTKVEWSASRGISWNSVEIDRASSEECEQDYREQKASGLITDENVNSVHLIDNGETITAYSDSDDLVFILNEVQKCYHRSLAASDGIAAEDVPTLDYKV